MPSKDNEKTSESSKKVVRSAAVAVGDAYTGGAGGVVVDKALDSKVGQKYLDKAGKAFEKQNPGAAKIAKKLDDMGALDAATSMLSMKAGGGAGGTKNAAGGMSPSKNNVGKNVLNNNNSISSPQKSSLDLDKERNSNRLNEQLNNNKMRALENAFSGTSGNYVPDANEMMNDKEKDKTEKKQNKNKTSNEKNDNSSGINTDKSKSSGAGKFLANLPIEAKLAIIGGAIGVLLLVIMITILTSSYVSDFLDLVGIGSAGLASEVEAASSDPELKELYERVLRIQKSDSSSGKTYDADKVIAVYHILVRYKPTFSPKDADDNWINEVVSLMFPDDCGTTCTYDEEIFRKNLEEKFFPKYLDGVNTGNCSGAGADNLIAIAEKEIGNNEADGSHAKYLKLLGLSSSEKWCAAFVSWVANEAGVDEKVIPHTASVVNFYDYFKEAGTFKSISSDYKPAPNDLIIWQANNRSHIGIVKSLKGDTLTTIEGNASNAVREKTYSFSSLAGSGVVGFAAVSGESNGTSCTDDSTAETIKNGESIKLPSGLGTYATREFDLAATSSEISYSRSQMQCCRKITNPYAFPESSSQRTVQNAWIKKGAKHNKQGFCMLDGRYLIAATSTFGSIGDKVDFYMSSGKIIHVILGDAKAQSKAWYDQNPANKWGHSNGACVLEFMGKNSIGNNPYEVLGLKGQTVVKAVNGGSAIK